MSTEIKKVVNAPGPREAKAKRIVEWLKGNRGYHWVALYDVGEESISAVAWTGCEARAFPTFARTKGLNGAAVASKQPVIVQDVSQDPRYLTTFGSSKGEMIVPVIADGGVVGTIDVESDRVNAFREEDRLFLEAFAKDINLIMPSSA